MLCGTCVVFLLLKQFSAQLATEAEVFFMLLIKLVGSETEASETQLSWMRVLVMEIIQGCVTLFFCLSCNRAYQPLYGTYKCTCDTPPGSVETLTSCVASGSTMMHLQRTAIPALPLAYASLPSSFPTLQRLITSCPSLLSESAQM